MPLRSPFIRPFAATARRRTWWIACKLAPICTSPSITTHTKPNWTSYSRRAARNERCHATLDRQFAERRAMTESQTVAFKPKKSVALSGVTAGNTALCTVGKTGNDLHYRGYDILDIATQCDFEEIAHLFVHEKL